MGTLSEMLGDMDIQSFFQTLFDGGWYDFVFPFLMVYAIVFTILPNIKIFSDDGPEDANKTNKKPIRIIIALIFAFFAIAFPISGDVASCGIATGPGGGVGSDSCQTLGGLMMTLFPGVTAFSFGVLGLYIVAGMLGLDLNNIIKIGKGNDAKPIVTYVIGGLGALIVVYYYARGFGWDGFGVIGDWWIWELLGDPALLMLIIFGFLFYWISKDETNSSEERGTCECEKDNKGKIGTTCSTCKTKYK